MTQQKVVFENTSLPDIVELRDVSLTYDGGKTFIIQNLNLLIEERGTGQFVSILGPSGCGKSTILRFLAGLQKPTTGQALIFGKSQTEKDRVGMVFQKYSSFPWLTVLENAELGLKIQGINAKERKERAMDMLRMVGIQDQYKKYAQYPTLSGGQLQRVAIARSLLACPQIMLLDEAFGALDIKTRLEMQEMICKLWSDLSKKNHATTFLLVTHDISEAVYLGDDVLIMSNPPAQIIDRIHIDLPLDRTRDMKKSDYFKNTVAIIEDKMMNLEQKKIGGS